MDKRDKAGTALGVGFLGCAAVLILAKLALIIGVIYVVIHFIQKYW